MSSRVDKLTRRRADARRRRTLWSRNLVRLALLAIVVGYCMLESDSANLFLLNTCLIACISALALGFLMGTAGQASLGTTAFLGLGGFGSVFLMRAGIPYGPSVLICGAAACIGGLIVGLPSLRLRGVYLALASLGAYFFMDYIGQSYQNRSAGPAGFVLLPVFNTSSDSAEQRYWAVLLFAVVALTSIVVAQLTAGRLGRALRMIRDHEAAAPALGIAVTRYKLLAFVFYAAVTAIAGGLAAGLIGDVSTDSYSLTTAISYVAMIVIGGMDSVTGALIGAFVVTLLPTVVSDETTRFSSSFAATYGSSVSEAIYGVAIMVLVTSGRGGLVGIGGRLWASTRRAVSSMSSGGAPWATSRHEVAAVSSHGEATTVKGTAEDAAEPERLRR